MQRCHDSRITTIPGTTCCAFQREVVPGILLDAVSDNSVVALLGEGQGVLRYLAHIVVSVKVLH